jgi:hypothetical protein
MTRRIMLDLAPDTTDEDCGSCNECGGAWVGGEWTNWSRGPDCIAAEAAAARMVEIAPEDVAKVRFDLWAPNGEPHECDAAERVASALLDHAAKAEVKP